MNIRLKLRSQLIVPALIALSMSYLPPASAIDLRVALSSEATSLDPHFYTYYPNLNLAHHLYETLVKQDSVQRLVPALATDWRAIDEKTWEFNLRQGVKFHDGTPFTAEDVAASIR